MKNLFTILTFLLAISSALSQDRVEEFVPKDSCYIAPTDGVFIDVDSYVGISYELEKVDSLKKAVPEFKQALNEIKVVKDSMAVAHTEERKKLSEALELEEQSKRQLKKRVVNLQHNYNIKSAEAEKFRKQRNRMGGISGGLLALLFGIIIL